MSSKNRSIYLLLTTSIGLASITIGNTLTTTIAYPTNLLIQEKAVELPNNNLHPEELLLLAQQSTFSVDAKTPYYVKDNSGNWREARLIGWGYSSRTGEEYTVKYVDGGTTEQGVTVNRIKTLEQAQSAGIATNVYDVSTQQGIDQMVNAHNLWRKEVGVDGLSWSTELATSAQAWADKLAFDNQAKHSSTSNGENLFWGGGTYSPKQVVDDWGSEKQWYDYSNNSCSAPPRQSCGHYTQVVWRNTTQVGCGVAKSSDQVYWVCQYSPAGNVGDQSPY